MSSPVEEILRALVRIESINPRLVQDGSGEGKVAAWIASFCRDHGIAHELQPVEDGRANLLSWVPGRQTETRLLFIAHMDTVPVTGWQGDPFSGETRDGHLYGRGACDTKASLAAMLQALATIRDAGPRATIVVAGSVDEEYRKAGASALTRDGARYDAAVVGEPTNLEIVVAHNGSVRWRVETRGRAAHTSRPDLGVNAITGMARVITAIEAMSERLKARAHPLTGSPSLTVSLITGGVHICIVPDRCEIAIDRRLIPGESPKHALAEVEVVLEELRRAHSDLEVRSLPAVEDPPVESAAKARIIGVGRSACRQVAGTGELRGVPYGTDASKLSEAGIDCIVLGPGSIDQAHTIGEYVELAEVERAVEVYRQIMLTF